MFKKLITLIVTLSAAVCFAALDFNKASEAELDSIKGIGPSTSSKILEERKKASFKDWNDLITRVKGIGEVKAAKFSAEGVTVNGFVFKSGQSAPVKTIDIKKTTP
jgi:competence protein ComEA